MASINTKKYRGSRTCGGGTHKNRRGAGNRGGRGRAGANKHHFVRALKGGYRKGYIRKGFTRPNAVVESVSIVNVGELDELVSFLNDVEVDYVSKDGDTFVVDLESIGIDKVLGSGTVKQKLRISASNFSAIAAEKIKAAGGECIVIGDEKSE